MCVKALTWAFEQNPGDHGTKLLLLCLADHANEDGECWPAIQRLAARCNMSRRTVERKLAKLEGSRFVRRERRARASNLYILHMGMRHPDAYEAVDKPKTVSADTRQDGALMRQNPRFDASTGVA